MDYFCSFFYCQINISQNLFNGMKVYMIKGGRGKWRIMFNIQSFSYAQWINSRDLLFKTVPIINDTVHLKILKSKSHVKCSYQNNNNTNNQNVIKFWDWRLRGKDGWKWMSRRKKRDQKNNDKLVLMSKKSFLSGRVFGQWHVILHQV